jgi:hypothetical protein
MTHFSRDNLWHGALVDDESLDSKVSGLNLIENLF